MAVKRANLHSVRFTRQRRRRMTDKELVRRFALMFLPTALLIGALASMLVQTLD